MGLLNNDILSFDEPAIGRDGVSLFDLQHVSDDYLTWGYFLLFVLSNNSHHVLFQKMMNFLSTTLEPKFLATPQNPI